MVALKIKTVLEGILWNEHLFYVQLHNAKINMYLKSVVTCFKSCNDDYRQSKTVKVLVKFWEQSSEIWNFEIYRYFSITTVP